MPIPMKVTVTTEMLDDMLTMYFNSQNLELIEFDDIDEFEVTVKTQPRSPSDTHNSLAHQIASVEKNCKGPYS